LIDAQRFADERIASQECLIVIQQLVTKTVFHSMAWLSNRPSSINHRLYFKH
jgi:hypothetical protein